ncbi:MAG: mechanosensitive ion channel [Candidatus Bathyarchaeota archaeon]|jgi:small-conductance mechanosensitive channel
MLEISWVASRVILLVILQFGLETIYKIGWFEVLGSQEIQRLVFDILKKGLLTLYLWLFLSIFKKFILPLIAILFTPVVDKIVTDPQTKAKHVTMVSRYFIYIAYLVSVLAFINIWVYSYVGVWLAGTLGTGVAIALTFVLGLFTSSVLGNVLGYWVINNVMEFEVGDRVQIGDSYGDVMDVGVFFTRIRTIKDETISIPNLLVVGREIKNFSSRGMVLIHVSVTLGYDVDKEKAKALLLESARETSGILMEGGREPFVLLTDLDKFTVTFEINAYTEKPNELVVIKSTLIDRILDKFREEKIELLSPDHVSVRGNIEK